MMPLERLKKLILSIDGTGFTKQTYSDIGRYIVFPEDRFSRIFPRKPFGMLKEDDFDRNNTWGIMCREEGLRITNDLHRLTLPSERNLPYPQLASWSNG